MTTLTDKDKDTELAKIPTLVKHKFYDEDIVGVLVDTMHLEAKVIELVLTPDNWGAILLSEDDIIAMAAHFADPIYIVPKEYPTDGS